MIQEIKNRTTIHMKIMVYFSYKSVKKGWIKNVVDELGNYDYLMFANIDYDILEVCHEMISWAKWVINTLKCDGFRLDAVKHINSDFMNEWLQAVHSYIRKRFYIVGEF
ncbi:MAG TPA: alpha-amylase family glycosyl hydrolase [Ureibacillus sp.]|nr:alpha-amylase family glycosyl hydrolase [Ureibacillus sp.]